MKMEEIESSKKEVKQEVIEEISVVHKQSEVSKVNLKNIYNKFACYG